MGEKGKKLKDYLDMLNVKYTARHLSETQNAILKKEMAKAVIYFRWVKEKDKIDPENRPEEYIKLLNELDEVLRVRTRNFLNDEDLPFVRNFVNLPLSLFIEDGKVKLSDIKVSKKGLNGHS